MEQAATEYGKLEFEDLNYATYLRLDRLLALQEPRSRPPHHDEMFFVVIHQAYELWFKEILHELDYLPHHLEEGSVSRALKVLKRVRAILDVLVRQIGLLQTLTPVEFAGFRHALGTGSGFQSLQFREVEFACGLREPFFLEFFSRWPEAEARLRARMEQPSVYDHFLRALAREGVPIPQRVLERDVTRPHELDEELVGALADLYRNPEDAYHQVLLAEALLDLDTAWADWRSRHVLMVNRTIGGRPGTGGSSGAAFLESRLDRRFFPDLWEVRNRIFAEGS